MKRLIKGECRYKTYLLTCDDGCDELENFAIMISSKANNQSIDNFPEILVGISRASIHKVESKPFQVLRKEKVYVSHFL